MKELMMSSLRKLVDDVLRHIVLEDDVLKEKNGTHFNVKWKDHIIRVLF